MKRDPNIPAAAGAFALVHAKTKVVYVGIGKDLKQRAQMWGYHVGKSDDSNYPMPIKNFPRHPPDEWAFVTFVGKDDGAVREAFKAKGYSIINPKSRTRNTYVVDGIDASLLKHAQRLKVSWPQVYYRFSKGHTARQALGLDPIDDQMDSREQRIVMMKTKIVGGTGGYLTYDEAQIERPDVGDIRQKVSRWRNRNPKLDEVKLLEL